ncbi:MAG TPA: hypothetical protein VFR67_29265, partial [Pilimelia sp.]|nr:hypothetical protein [Pilimelia sp.]
MMLSYVLLALLVLVGALVAVRVQMRDTPAIGRTVWAMALLVPIAGVLITPVTMGFASLTGYSTSTPVVLAEIAIVAAALSGAAVLARGWALAPVRRPLTRRSAA